MGPAFAPFYAHLFSGFPLQQDQPRASIGAWKATTTAPLTSPTTSTPPGTSPLSRIGRTGAMKTIKMTGTMLPCGSRHTGLLTMGATPSEVRQA